MWKLCGEKKNPRKTLCGNYVEIKIANFAKSRIMERHANAAYYKHADVKKLAKNLRKF